METGDAEPLRVVGAERAGSVREAGSKVVAGIRGRGGVLVHTGQLRVVSLIGMDPAKTVRQREGESQSDI